MLPGPAKPLTSFPTPPGLAMPLHRGPPRPDPPMVFPVFGLGRLMVHSVCMIHLGLTTGFGSETTSRYVYLDILENSRARYSLSVLSESCLALASLAPSPGMRPPSSTGPSVDKD